MKKQMGYLMVDHSASPGLPEDIARMVGYDPALCREGKKFEVDTLCCAHCKNHVVPNPLRARERYDCPKCNHHYVCDWCAEEMRQPDYDHTPYEKKIELAMRPAMRLGTPVKLIGG